MITLQAEPLIQWDETKVKLMEQSEDCQNWLRDNLMVEDNKETVWETKVRTAARYADNPNLDRPASYTYNNGSFELVQTFTYKDDNSWSGMTDNSVLTSL